MFAKMLFIIVCVSATICALLVIRQHRIDTFHEISSLHQRLVMHERALWELRIAITEQCRPSQIRLAMASLKKEWAPLRIDRRDSHALSITDDSISFHAAHMAVQNHNSSNLENET